MTVDTAELRRSLNQAARPLDVDFNALVNALPALLDRLDTYREALTYYAERRNYKVPGGDPPEPPYDVLDAVDGYDGKGPGARARAALDTEQP